MARIVSSSRSSSGAGAKEEGEGEGGARSEPVIPPPPFTGPYGEKALSAVELLSGAAGEGEKPTMTPGPMDTPAMPPAPELHVGASGAGTPSLGRDERDAFWFWSIAK
jgi:hypothetical protein